MNNTAVEKEATTLPLENPEDQARLDAELAKNDQYQKTLALLRNESSKKHPNKNLETSLRKTVIGIEVKTWKDLQGQRL